MRVHPPTPLPAELERFAWVRGTLEQWRTEEGLRGVLDGNPIPQNAPIMPITREPLELTIPPLVMRTDRHDRTIREQQERFRQLEAHMRERVEPRVAGTEGRAIQNTQGMAVLRARLEMAETENAHLREDVQELTDTVAAMEEYNDLIEQRLEVVEDDFASIQTLANTLTRVIDALRQIQPPPPPPQQ